MRILHIISNLMSGGAESMLTKVIEALPAPRHHHVVVSFINGGIYADRLADQGIRIISLDQSRGGAIQALAKLPALKRIVAQIDPQIVQGWMYHGNLAASYAAGSRPALWNVRQRLERLRDNRAATQLTVMGSLAFRSSVKAVIYNSARAATEHEARGYPRSKRVLIPNGFDLSTFAPWATARDELRNELGLPRDTLLVGRIARDDAIKDTPTLLRAFAHLAARDARLVLAGRGMVASNARLLDQIQQLGLAERIHLVGERLDIPRLNAAFDLAVLSSSHAEGFPNVVCEAMACGTPIVTTDVGECREILHDDSRISPIRDPQSLAANMDRVLALSPDARREIGAHDRQRVAACYALPVVAGRYATLWEHVAST